MEDESKNLRQVTRENLILAALSALAILQVVGVLVVSCSPKAAQYVEPVVSYSSAVCPLLEEGSAEREVCDASVRLAQALERLRREQENETTATTATGSGRSISVTPVTSRVPTGGRGGGGGAG
jgi:hypothetical protein